MDVWRGSSIIAVFLLAGFNALPEELLDAGRLEARGARQYFRRVVAPLSRRFFILAILVALVITYIEYVSMYVETGGRITVSVLGTLAFREAIQNGNAGLGAALALIPVPFVVAGALCCLRFLEGPAACGGVPAGGRSSGSGAGTRREAAGPSVDPPAQVPRVGDRLRRFRRFALLGGGATGALAVMAFHLFPVYYTAVQAVRSVREYARISDFVEFDPAFAIKFSIYRITPSGSPGDSDIFGAQSNTPRCWMWRCRAPGSPFAGLPSGEAPHVGVPWRVSARPRSRAGWSSLITTLCHFCVRTIEWEEGLSGRMIETAGPETAGFLPIRANSAP